VLNIQRIRFVIKRASKTTACPNMSRRVGLTFIFDGNYFSIISPVRFAIPYFDIRSVKISLRVVHVTSARRFVVFFRKIEPRAVIRTPLSAQLVVTIRKSPANVTRSFGACIFYVGYRPPDARCAPPAEGWPALSDGTTVIAERIVCRS